MQDIEFSYWLGLIYSDGCLTSKQSNYKYCYDRLQLKLVDLEVIEEFANYINESKNRIRSEEYKTNTIYFIDTGNKSIINLFKDYGLCYRKTYENLRLPNNIDVDSFVLGYFEGNGSLTDNRVFINGPKSLMQDIKDYYNDFNISLVTFKNSTRLEILGGLKERVRFLDRLYSTGQYRMKRKYNSYSQYRAKLEEKSKK